ncbi:hypothetical protein ACP6PL_08370 [Dapis sp. BLCC M126]|uniref:hypothetical protein n=1 Tax=Dapis sp. BLCC M126 TaxID=3400189 RepID=UPI003CE74528
MFVFGDSLSDPGNKNRVTRNSSIYFEGRASNGYVFADILTSCLDLEPTPFTRRGISPNGTNFAKDLVCWD